MFEGGLTCPLPAVCEGLTSTQRERIGCGSRTSPHDRHALTRTGEALVIVRARRGPVRAELAVEDDEWRGRPLLRIAPRPVREWGRGVGRWRMHSACDGARGPVLAARVGQDTLACAQALLHGAHLER